MSFEKPEIRPFSFSNEEKSKIRQEAEARGADPEEALRQAETSARANFERRSAARERGSELSESDVQEGLEEIEKYKTGDE